MRRFTLNFIFVAILSLPASADVLFTGFTASDDNSGAFLSGMTTLMSGNSFTINLPNYFTSNFGSFAANEVDFLVTATAQGGANILELDYTYLGTFTGAGMASFTQTAGAPSASGSFSTSPKSGSILVSPTSSLNITTQLNLNDGGDSAGVNQVKFDLVLSPEPATMGLTCLALGLFGAGMLRRRVGAPKA